MVVRRRHMNTDITKTAEGSAMITVETDAARPVISHAFRKRHHHAYKSSICIFLVFAFLLVGLIAFLDLRRNGILMMNSSIPTINPKPAVFYLYTNSSFIEGSITGKQLYDYDASEEEEWRFYRRPEPYVDQSMCAPMETWQLTIYPTCNIFHEVDIIFNERKVKL